MSESSNGFKPQLSLFDATMIVAGSMIGSGIFIVSADIARNVGSPGLLILVWLLTGVMTIIAAVSYGELSGMFPKAGGQYVYLREAYNPLMGFLYGWSFFAVIQTATIAAVGVAFARYTGYIFKPISESNILFSIGKLNISAAQLFAIASIVLLTFINTRGIKEGKLIQSTFTISKLIALFGLTVLGFILADSTVWNQNWELGFTAMQDLGVGGNGKEPTNWTEIAGITLVGAIAAAMTGSLFSSDAWNNVTFIAGEIKNPQKNIGLALFFGTLLVTIIYVAANLMYIYVVPFNDLAFPQDDRLAMAAADRIFGGLGKYLIAVLIMIATFGCNNGLILAGSRVYYTMAKDGLFFKKAGELNKNLVPNWSLWIQCLVASILCLSGSYGNLLDMISFVVVVFYVLTIVGIFILRKKQPNTPRPYKAFGYPILPILYIVMGISFCVLLLIFKTTYTIWGLGIVLIGIPIYYAVVSRNKKSEV